MSGIRKNLPVVIEIVDSSDENENDCEYALLKRLSLTKNRTPSRDYSSSNQSTTSDTGEITHSTESTSSNTTDKNEELPKTTLNRRRSLQNLVNSADEGEPVAKKIQNRRMTVYPSASAAEELVPKNIQKRRNSVDQSTIPASNEETHAGMIQNRRKSVYPSTSSFGKDDFAADKIQSSSKKELLTETILNSHYLPFGNVEPTPQKIENRRKSLYPLTSTADKDEQRPGKIQNRRYSVHPSLVEEVPAKIHNRRKSVHHAIKSTDGLTFETDNEEETTTKAKKKRPIDNLNAASDDIIDEEMKHLLKKIAYCRVFTNYLLGQYNMLTIDFKLYSDLEQLKLELKKRVDTYTAIRRSRQELMSADK